MARKIDTEERVLSAAAKAAVEEAENRGVEAPQQHEIQQTEPQQKDFMAHLMALKAELEATKAELAMRESAAIEKELYARKIMQEMTAKQNTLEKREALVAMKEQDKTAPAMNPGDDRWKQTRTMFVPRGSNGEQKYYYVCINGKGWKIPRGRSVEMPLPIHERLMIMLERDAAAQRYRDSIPENGEIGAPGAKATRM